MHRTHTHTVSSPKIHHHPSITRKAKKKGGIKQTPSSSSFAAKNAATTKGKDDDDETDVATTMPPWAKEDQRTSASQKALTNNVSFALVNPQGPMNVGSCARVMQNFGIYDLKIVRGSAFVFDPADDADDAEEEEEEEEERQKQKEKRTTLTKKKKKRMSREAYKFACAADWMLERASEEEWYPDVTSATADRTVVFATTARNRDGSQPMLDSREACRIAAKLALDGEKVSFLFGNERVGLTNEELRTAQYLVAIPTAGVGEVCGKSSKYTGSLGPTSLNLSHAVGVLAYEAFVETTLEEDRIRKSRNDDDDDGSSSSSSSSCSNSDNNSGSAENTTASLRKQTNAGKMDTDKLMSSGEKQQLTRALFSARRSLDVFPAGDATKDEESTTDLQAREFKAIERVLSNPNLRGRDAAVLFQIARRILAAMKKTNDDDDDDDDDDDESPLEKVVIDELQKEKKVDAPIKEARNALRDRCNVSLTNREILEAQRRASRTTTITK